MNDAIDKLPKFIEAPGGGMWGPMPAGFTIDNEDAIFVRLRDVRELFPRKVVVTEKIICHDGQEFVSVGKGGAALVDAAHRHAWDLHAKPDGGPFSGSWVGNSEDWEYFIKKEKS